MSEMERIAELVDSMDDESKSVVLITLLRGYNLWRWNEEEGFINLYWSENMHRAWAAFGLLDQTELCTLAMFSRFQRWWDDGLFFGIPPWQVLKEGMDKVMETLILEGVLTIEQK